MLTFDLTFHDVDEWAHVPFLDDEAVLGVVHGVHAVHDLPNLAHVQVLHEVVVEDGWPDQIPGTTNRKWK